MPSLPTHIHTRREQQERYSLQATLLHSWMDPDQATGTESSSIWPPSYGSNRVDAPSTTVDVSLAMSSTSSCVETDGN